MKLSIAVQTHELREPLARELAEMIGGDVELVLDPEPHGKPSPWRTYREALETTPAGATHRLVIQDDAYPCRSFRPAVEQVIAARPDRLIVLFVSGRLEAAVMRACQAGQRWLELGGAHWCPVVAAVWPVELIPPLLEYVDRQRREFTADDEIIGKFLRVTKRNAIATVPSLVEHPDDVESLKGNAVSRTKKNVLRVAACFIADDLDPLSIDWAA